MGALKDALRGGNVAAPCSSSPRAVAIAIARSSRPDRAPSQVDLILTDLRFVQFRDNTVELEMLRTDERGSSRTSCASWSRDGLRRLKASE